MKTSGFALFETAIGRCGIAWGERGVSGVQLPEARVADTRARLHQRFPDAREAAAPPPAIRRAIDAITALLRGETDSEQNPQRVPHLPRWAAAAKPPSPHAILGTIALDMQGVPPFHRRVYELTRKIPPGTTLSYGQVAARLGAHGAARAVGQALRRNPFAIVVPCHRVLAAGGKVGGFSAEGGVMTKLRMLAIEGARPRALPDLFEFEGPA